MDIKSLQQQISEGAEQNAMPPVEQWDPTFCGNMNLVIKRSGQWLHEGTPFTRAPLVKLFASVIKKEGNDYFLVTPVEKIGITVEDVPFVIIDDVIKDDKITVTTSCGDQFLIGEEHPVEIRTFEGNGVPYCLVRRNLWARIHQNVLYRWADRAKQIEHNGVRSLCLLSGDYQFSIGTY